MLELTHNEVYLVDGSPCVYKQGYFGQYLFVTEDNKVLTVKSNEVNRVNKPNEPSAHQPRKGSQNKVADTD